jgi:CRISPR type I-E-associated protein CasB/Cse2
MSANPRTPLPTAISFLSYLQRYRQDRGALANLRGALSEARRPNAWPLLAGFKDAVGSPAYETVAALWAGGVDLAASGGNVGDTVAVLVQSHHSFEGRFRRLLTCERDEIGARVAPLVRAAQRNGTRVNYTQLLSDLLCWGDEVRVRWAKAFWGAAKSGGGPNAELIDEEEA